MSTYRACGDTLVLAVAAACKVGGQPAKNTRLDVAAALDAMPAALAERIAWEINKHLHYTAAARLTNADTESWRKLRDRCSEVARP